LAGLFGKDALMTRRVMILLAFLLSAWPLAAQVDVGCGPTLPLAPGSRINTRPGIYIRNLPTLSGGIAEYLDSSITFRVVGGPVCADGLNWWQVRGPVNFNPGWVAEREAADGRYLIFPADPDPAAACTEPLNLVPGSRVPLLNGVRIRQEPNLSGLVLTVAPQGEVVTVISGPECVDELNWWQVQVPFAGIIVQGWMAEGYPERDFVRDPDLPDPSEICGPPIPLKIGNRASVNVEDFRPKNLRAAPGRQAPVLYALIEGIAFDVIGGPVCADNLNWWQIQIVARPEVTGWLAEGGPGNLAISRFTDDHIPGR
jgi:hypothetical protein